MTDKKKRNVALQARLVNDQLEFQLLTSVWQASMLKMADIAKRDNRTIDDIYTTHVFHAIISLATDMLNLAGEVKSGGLKVPEPTPAESGSAGDNGQPDS